MQCCTVRRQLLPRPPIGVVRLLDPCSRAARAEREERERRRRWGGALVSRDTTRDGTRAAFLLRLRRTMCVCDRVPRGAGGGEEGQSPHPVGSWN